MFTKMLFTLFFLQTINADQHRRRVKRIVGGIPVDPPPEDDPTVYTHFSGKSARVRGVREFPHYVFRGIKYAYAPIGKDRFLRPRQKFLEGEINATVYSAPCVQPRPGTDIVIGNEDCLALNIFTPELPMGMEGLPVVVWIHGGGFRYGSASQYGVRHLVGKQLVVVTIQYRLGSLGFLSSGTKHLPGNVALWDMVLAIQWVRNYIGFFGGNPYRIVVMGHGTGASSALLVALSNVAKGLPSGVIAMSGTAISKRAMDNTPQKTAEEIAAQNGCPTSNPVTMVKCLQTVSSETIIRGDSNIEFNRLNSEGFMSTFSGDTGSAPVTEGHNDGRSLPGLIEKKPMTDLDEENNPDIPLLTGVCKDETKKAIRGRPPEDIIHKLTTIPNFLDKVLIENLKNLLPLSTLQEPNSTLNSILSFNFGNYLQLEKQNLDEALNKIGEITGDVLFNVPAFLTVDRWSRNGAATFLYSFEHVGKRNKGDIFLRGSPLIGNETFSADMFKGTVGHGDDLGYLFEVNDITGESLETGDDDLSEDDRKVRDFFTQMISDFARYGVLRLNDQDVKPFNRELNNFIQIKAKPVLAADFKFCEMALWCNLLDRLKSVSCTFLNALNTHIKHTENVMREVLNEVRIKQPKIDGIFGSITNPSHGIFGGLGNDNQNQDSKSYRNNLQSNNSTPNNLLSIFHGSAKTQKLPNLGLLG